MPQTRKPAAERKAEIVETAIRLAADIGPDRLTTDRLAKEIGISQAAIFRHFSTKSNIWEAVGEHICKLMGASAPKGPEGESFEGTLNRMIMSQLSFISKTPAVPAILFSRELHAENDTLRQFFADMMQQRHQRLTQVISAGIDAGEFSPSIDAADCAYLVLAQIQGLAMRWSLNARDFDIVVEGKRVFAQLLAGFKPR